MPMWNLLAAIIFASPPEHLVQIAQNSSQSDLPLSQIPLRILYAADPVLAKEGGDPIGQRVTENFLSTLQRSGYSKAQQGVWIQSQNGVLLSSHLGDQPLPVASLTKIATTLGALTAWKAESRFITRIGTTGEIVGTTLKGDLVIGGGGDPLLVWEEAIGIGNALQSLGIRQVQGDLVVAPGFYMNFEPDRLKSAAFFRQALNANTWDSEITSQYQTLPIGTRRPQITIRGATKFSAHYNATTLINHRSLPLWQILKQMNIFSNNTMAEMLMAHLGGAATVTQRIVQQTGISPREIKLINGSGLGQANQLSPRAVVALLMAIHNQVRPQGLTVADFFPIGACRCGTIQDRDLPASAILKTGTLSDVSSLAGIIQTRDRGVLWFSLINRGAGEIGIFHQAQAALLAGFIQSWAELPVWQPKPWKDTDRNEVIPPSKLLSR